MKPEALDAFATQSTRPSALEAAAASQSNSKQDSLETNMTIETSPHRPALSRLNTPIGQRTDGTESAAKAVEGVVKGVKVAVHGAVAWTEKKADELAKMDGQAGPYDSPATAAGGISDLDGIAMGVLPATGLVREDGGQKEMQGNGQSRS